MKGEHSMSSKIVYKYDKSNEFLFNHMWSNYAVHHSDEQFCHCRLFRKQVPEIPGVVGWCDGAG